MITFGYDVCGKLDFADCIRVVMVRTVVTPRLTLAAAALRSRTRLVKDISTINVAGI